jgi:hypothetical protein
MDDIASSSQGGNTAPYPNQTSDLVNGSTGIPLSKTVNAGLEGEASSSQTSGTDGDDSHEFHLGAFVDGRLTRFITLHVAAGYQNVSISSGGLGSTEDISDYYGDVSIVHLINPVCTESLDFGHGITPSLATTSEKRSDVDYSIDWNVIRNAAIGTSVFAEEVTTLPDVDSEHLRRIGAAISFSYRFDRQTTVNAEYQHLHKSSSLAGAGYEQNSLLLDLNHQF